MTDDQQTTDTLALAAVIQGCGLFMPEEAENFIGSLPEHFASKGEGRVWLLAGEGAGVAHRSPEIGPGVWNLLFLGVLPEQRRRGVARALVAAAEVRAREAGGRCS
ncbi:GNAT family N-acetyltransferase [Rubellimicrobium rubrum]|uniref:GNAT family N-acetyltransferase n=1 Tax=Rubellimicrobium rubrum TaxID=2585369 RepID=A0A5C4MIE2_9RHOB|nr:GNAT family N-acetyltransferase [Rubellimicrobium rubrum]TNC44606.1 GNAT family N-acetyltransferase [Rubellimicrobium rubrum]